MRFVETTDDKFCGGTSFVKTLANKDYLVLAFLRRSELADNDFFLLPDRKLRRRKESSPRA